MYSQILEYIKKCKDLKIDDVAIVSVLKSAGWKEADINYSMSEYQKINSLPPPPAPNYEAPTKAVETVVATKALGKVGLKEKMLKRLGKLAGIFKNKKKVKVDSKVAEIIPETIKVTVTVDPNVNVEPNIKVDPNVKVSTKKKVSKFIRTFRFLKTTFTILFGLSIIGFTIWWVVSLNDKSATINANADNARLQQIAKVKEGVNKYYSEHQRLPATIGEIDPKKEFTIDKGSNQQFDFKVLSAKSFQTCTVFYEKGITFEKGYVCFPFNVDTSGGMIAGLAFNPLNPADVDNSIMPETSIPFYGCKNPKPLLTANVRCPELDGNCRKPIINQEFGMSSIGISNSKDKVAQTFVLPKNEPAKEITEIAPYIFTFYGNMGCMSIYEQAVATEPQSGKLLAEYEIDLNTLVKESYNHFFISPITLDPKKTYSIVFSLLDNDSFISFAKGNELSSYYEGSAYYLKRPITDCSGKGCPKVEWIDRKDDLKFKLKFF